MSERLSTGITSLDRVIGGGAIPGSVTTLLAPPSSESALLIEEFVAQRPTLYLSTMRDPRIVEERLSKHDLDAEAVDIVSVDASADLRTAREALERIEEGWNVVVDPMDPLEDAADDETLQQFLNELKLRVLDLDGAALLHCTRHDDTSALRATTLTLSDAVWDLRSTVGTNEVEEHLVVRKFSGGSATDELVKLDFETSATVDTSRDIG